MPYRKIRIFLSLSSCKLFPYIQVRGALTIPVKNKADSVAQWVGLVAGNHHPPPTWWSEIAMHVTSYIDEHVFCRTPPQPMT